MIDGEPWFHATDVCLCLGLGVQKGTHNHTRRLDADEQRRVTPSQARGLRGAGATFVNESGLYKLILRSDKATAKPFQDWVTKEVLPSIRKTGSYSLAEHGREQMPLPDGIMQLFQQMTVMMERTSKPKALG